LTTRVYRIGFDLRNFAPVMIDGDDSVFRQWRPQIKFDGTPRNATWEAPPLWVENPLAPPPDIACLVGSTGLVLRSTAVEAVGAHLLGVGELLEARLAGEPLWVANVTQVVDCLDQTSTARDKYGAIDSYTFLDHRLPESTVFKLPDTAEFELLTVERNDDREFEFKPAFEDSGLTGLGFAELWNTEQGALVDDRSPFRDM
jgi:hypothetical protein